MLCRGRKRLRSSDEALYLGSAKANIGHGEAASGASSLIKVLVMMIKKKLIPPHYRIKTKINHKSPIDLNKRRVQIALKPIAWQKTSNTTPRGVFINNFSAAGGNSVLLLEDALSFRGDVEFDARLMHDRPRFVFSRSVVLRHRAAHDHFSSLTHYEKNTCTHALLQVLHLTTS
jgi:acyl transferase domain-containing protein